MSDGKTLILEITPLEAAHLTDLVRQFAELLESSRPASDPAVARLVPDVYADDPAGSAEFRRLTEPTLLERRSDDAALVMSSLAPLLAEDAGDLDPVALPLDPPTASAWMRCLAALRLVLAERLGIQDDTDGDTDDPRFGVYEWLGYRLDGLVNALDA
ncbi:MAG: hypothetical protein CMH34_07315 [Microbacterium sp.]|uniref:DUF2017 family protein n=1 Tax=Microbacterium aquimaris TaxID=459816 RepID=UPI000C952600|nr:DUF2017 family protein [Microbacterium aquimaris]MAP63538.1 hypothetical protein [Microbacterium sp.]MDZ8275860.1 DUF2017 family protein [Microbacterium aquimaris]